MPKFLNLKTAVIFLFTVVIFGRAALDSTLPMDCDEGEVVLQCEQGRVWQTRGNPLDASSHFLPAMLTAISVKTLGPSRAAARLPGLVISGLLLVLLAWVSLQHLNTAAAVLLYSHLLVNENVNWFFHSNRAYPLMLLLGLAIPYGLFRMTFVQPISLRTFVLASLLAFLLSALTHHLSLVFCTTCFTGFAIWVFCNRSSLPLQITKQGKWLGILSAIFLVTSLTLLALSARDLQTRGLGYARGLGFSSLSDVVSALPQILHQMQDGFTKLLSIFGNFLVSYHLGLVLTALVLFGLTGWRKDKRLSFLFTLVSFNLLAIAGLCLVTGGWNVRYFLFIFPLGMLTLGTALDSLQVSKLRWAFFSALFFLLVWGPFTQSDPHITTHFCVPYTHQPPLRSIPLPKFAS